MNWNVFFAVITWAITTASGIAVFMSTLIIINEGIDENYALKTAAISLIILILGIATINGMGWTAE